MAGNESPDSLGGPGSGGATRRWLWPLVAAGIALALVLVAVVLRAGRDGGPVPAATTTAATSGAGSPTTGATSAPTTGTAPSTSATTAPSTASTTSPAPTTSPATGQLTVPVYYVVDVPGVGPRLYREFHRVPATGDRVTTALTEMFAGTPLDPDYRSLWPASTRVLSAKRTGAGVVEVDVSGFVSLGAAFETAAVQQLVHTATAADPACTQVSLLVRGATPPSGHADWSAPVKRSAALETLSNVWILAPAQDATVSSPVTVRVYGTGWEGNVPLKVFKGSAVVASTAVTTMMGGFATAGTTITLPPGHYELRAYNDNGKDSSLQLWDTKTFTVR